MIVIDPAHNGPPGCAQGGVAAGRFAALVDARRARVRLHARVPLGRRLTHQRTDDGSATVTDGARAIATVSTIAPIQPPPELPLPALDSVVNAEAGWDAVHRDRHPYPTCFGCGPRRPAGTGLHLRPGLVAGLGVYATRWCPDEEIPAWLVWAALDCGSAGPVADAAGGTTAVTGELAVDIREMPPGGSTSLIISRPTARDGRKIHITAALVDALTGRHYAAAETVWLTRDPERTS